MPGLLRRQEVTCVARRRFYTGKVELNYAEGPAADQTLVLRHSGGSWYGRGGVSRLHHDMASAAKAFTEASGLDAQR